MSYIFNESIDKIIKTRHSVRTYDNRGISNDINEKLQNYINEINNTEGVFGNKIKITLIQKESSNKQLKLGTYGVITGANYYLLVSCKNSDNSLEDLGFLFEKFIFYVTSLGLGTVWLAGSFNKSDFLKAVNLDKDEILPIVSPVGFEAEQKTLVAKFFGRSSLKRKDFTEIFFTENFDTPLVYDNDKEYGDILENVRLAPSSMNSQPWRILKEGNNYHIYSAGKMDINKIDIGIGLCHFYLSALEKGLDGKFKVLSDKNNDKFKYVISWIKD